MGDVNGVEYTKTQNTPRDQVLANTWHGRVRCQYDTYEATALTSGSTIHMGKLLTDSRVVDMLLFFDALGTSSTLQVGDMDKDGVVLDANRYITSTSSAAAGSARLNAITGMGYVTTEETDIVITTGGAAITGSIALATFYMLD